ncbi:hypothetical protein TNCV_952101 [Trichonephila clavipes]|nr:hypothetical protein TNCV_952101 [Trichonephila clavipes]
MYKVSETEFNTTNLDPLFTSSLVAVSHRVVRNNVDSVVAPFFFQEPHLLVLLPAPFVQSVTIDIDAKRTEVKKQLANFLEFLKHIASLNSNYRNFWDCVFLTVKRSLIQQNLQLSVQKGTNTRDKSCDCRKPTSEPHLLI